MDPIIVTYSFESSLDKVWNALSDEHELKKWFFPVQNYKFEVGNDFSFFESEESRKYFHRCRFLKIIPRQLIEYTWAHPNHSKGSSVVKWEFQEEGERTRVTLTHTGVENFTDAGEAFSKANFEMCWNSIVTNLLRNHLYGIQKLVFEVEINATGSMVWQMLWGKENYTRWMEPFCPDTYYTGKLNQGERIHFLSPSGEGIYSDIVFYKENELIIFKHLGMMKESAELPIDASTEKWTGCFESYKLLEFEGGTRLKVEVDIFDNLYEPMKNDFPRALGKLKELSEMPQRSSVDIDKYIARFPKETQALLEQLRTTIRKAAPEAEEVISYQMPAFSYHGILVYFAGNKNHIGFYPTSSGIAAFKNELSVYKGAKGSVQFPLDKPLPLGLITKIVQFRARENSEKAISKFKTREK